MSTAKRLLLLILVLPGPKIGQPNGLDDIDWRISGIDVFGNHTVSISEIVAQLPPAAKRRICLRRSTQIVRIQDAEWLRLDDQSHHRSPASWFQQG